MAFVEQACHSKLETYMSTICGYQMFTITHGSIIGIKLAVVMEANSMTDMQHPFYPCSWKLTCLSLYLGTYGKLIPCEKATSKIMLISQQNSNENMQQLTVKFLIKWTPRRYGESRDKLFEWNRAVLQFRKSADKLPHTVNHIKILLYCSVSISKIIFRSTKTCNYPISYFWNIIQDSKSMMWTNVTSATLFAFKKNASYIHVYTCCIYWLDLLKWLGFTLN